jgi:hypothetical protein
VVWSFSQSRAFDRCQRGWFYDAIYGNGVAKDKDRHEIYLLSKLQSISAWRGSIVDKAIETSLVPALKNGRPGQLRQTVARAKQLFDAQRAFALRHGLRDDGLKPSKAGDDFAAFLAVERGEQISDDVFEKAWREIERALNNLFGMTDLLDDLRRAEFLMAQRALQFKHGEVTVKAVPDLVAFYRGRPPLIVDWKVHLFGSRDYWLQLATYALALARCSPHRDFPRSFIDPKPTAMRLVEAQLLTNSVREHEFDADDVMVVEDYIAASAERMAMAVDGRKSVELSASDFPVAIYPDSCEGCPFRKPCWEAQA